MFICPQFAPMFHFDYVTFVRLYGVFIESRARSSALFDSKYTHAPNTCIFLGLMKHVRDWS